MRAFAAPNAASIDLTEENRTSSSGEAGKGLALVLEKVGRPQIRTALLIFLCFLLTSTSWLAWEYHLLTFMPARATDLSTMGIGYLLQAAGTGLFIFLIRHREDRAGRLFFLAMAVHTLCMLPAVLSPFPAAALAFGFLMNLACGFIAGGYLHELTLLADPASRARVFAAGYALSILASWLLSLIRGGTIYYSGKVTGIVILLTVLTALIVWKGKALPAEERAGAPPESIKPGDLKFFLLLAALVLLFSLVNNTGFAFSSADLAGSVNVEFSRLIYAVGLLAAGYITDRSRKYGAVCALTALIMPFMILSLKGEALPVVIFWALSYFTFGFYSVYRVILFSDLALSSGLLYLSAAGLMLGRVGDALGEVLCLVLAEHPVAMVILSAILFAAASAVFFKAYARLYIPETVKEETEKEKFDRFAREHDLSAREKDMLRLILLDKTVHEIADELTISDNTVKYHVKNILQKTGCRTRKILIDSYREGETKGRG